MKFRRFPSVTREPYPKELLSLRYLRYYQVLLSLRYLRSRFSAVAALLAVAFGVAVIVIVLAIMSGYLEELRSTIRGQESHLMIQGGGSGAITRIARLSRAVGEIENVAATAPVVETMAMYRSGQFNPCFLRGIDPDKHVGVSDLGRYVLRPAELESVLATLDVEGDAEDRAPASLRRSEVPAATRVIDALLRAEGRADLTGEELESFFELPFRQKLLEEHDPAVLLDLQGDLPPATIVGIHMLLDRELFLGQIATVLTLQPGSSEPVSRKFLVAGAFKTGNYHADSQNVYVHVDALKNMLGLFDKKANSYGYDGLRIAVSDLSKLRETQGRIQRLLSSSDYPEYHDLEVRTWEQLRGNMLDAVEIEKFLVYFLLVLLMGFTACMVLLVLLLMVIEKTRDMGILLALGATRLGVVLVFLTNGLLLTLSGMFLGLGLGYLFCLYINPIHDWIFEVTGLRLFPVEIYDFDRIPVAFWLSDILWSILPPIVFGFLASLSPSVWAVLRDPIKSINRE